MRLGGYEDREELGARGEGYIIPIFFILFLSSGPEMVPRWSREK